jgi:hypothetical protein
VLKGQGHPVLTLERFQAVSFVQEARHVYRYVETPNGGRVNIVTTDPEPRAAVHAFLRFQITDHKTGDPITVRPR